MNMGNCIADAVMIVVLGIFSLEDIRKKSLGIKQVIAVMTAALLYRAYSVRETGIKWEEAFATGVFISILAAGTLLKIIGGGDVAVMMILSLVKGFVFAFSVFVIAVTVAAVISILLLCIGRVGRKYAMPLIPYICAGALGVILCG